MKDRLNELEFKVAYQEDMIDSLNQSLAAQQQDLLMLQEQLQLLGKMLESYRTQQATIDNQPPPHY
ncbi:SlyX protein [Marinomonas agarivorans]|nr:SlyX protein [Marinomonas agarivorans]